jgi:hypothetical protein
LAKIKSITELVGLPPNFVLLTRPNIQNAYAFSSVSGTRYILVDNNWLHSLSLGDWFVSGVIAHEIGHHLCGHTVKSRSTDLSESRAQETEADRFSGFILRKLGASLEQALTAVKLVTRNQSNELNSTHPNREVRIKAVTSGFEGSQSKLLENDGSEMTAEYYFNLAYSIAPDPGLATPSALLFTALDTYKKALEQNPEFTDALLNSAGIVQVLGNKGELNYEKSVQTCLGLYRKILDRDPNNLAALNNKGQLYSVAAFRLDNLTLYEMAITYFDSCIELQPTEGGYYLNRGICYLNLGGDKIGKACYDFKKACGLGINAACTHFNNACR